MPGRTDTTSNDGRKSFFIAYGDAIPALQGENSDELLAPDQAATLMDNIIQLFPTADLADDVSAEPAICLEEAKRFLKALDSTATKFTFQTFDDNKERKKPREEENKKRGAAGISITGSPSSDLRCLAYLGGLCNRL